MPLPMEREYRPVKEPGWGLFKKMIWGDEGEKDIWKKVEKRKKNSKRKKVAKSQEREEQ